MKTNVSRRTSITLADGRPACVRCFKRAKRQITINGRVKWLSYCRTCQSNYERERREGKVQTYLTPAEYDAIRIARAEELQLRAVSAGEWSELVTARRERRLAGGRHRVMASA